METTTGFSTEGCSKEIHHQHRVLLDSISLVRDSIAKGINPAVIYPLLAHLASLAKLHFAYEEGSMRDHRYPGTERHAREHATFMSDLKALLALEPRIDLSVETIRCIETRLLEHAACSDALLVSWLAERDAGIQ